MVWLDLCAGLGAASQPALDRGWKVIRVDINPAFKPEVVADVRALAFRAFPIDVLWASPPCEQFSRWGMRCFHPNPPLPDLSIANAIRQAISDLRPARWFVENVWAARPWLSPIFGPVRNRIPGHVIYSNTLVLMPNIPPHKGSLTGTHKSGRRWGPVAHTRTSSAGPSRLAEKAAASMLPYEVGDAICRSAETREGSLCRTLYVM